MPPTRVTPRVGYRMRLNKDPVDMGEMFGKQSARTISCIVYVVEPQPCSKLIPKMLFFFGMKSTDSE